MTRTELEERLDVVASRIPDLREKYPDRDDLLQALAGELDLIEDAAVDPSDARFVANSVDKLLAAAGVA